MVLAYHVPKLLQIDYWQLGLFYYLSCIGLFVTYGAAVFQSGDYLLKEDIVGRANPYVQQGRHPAYACEDTGNCATVHAGLASADYCASPDHLFQYDSTFRYFSGT